MQENLTLKEVGKIETRRECQGQMIKLREECDWCNECFCFILKVEINRTFFKDNTEDFGEKECGLLYRYKQGCIRKTLEMIGGYNSERMERDIWKLIKSIAI